MDVLWVMSPGGEGGVEELAGVEEVTLAAARPPAPPDEEEMVRIRRHVTLEIDPPTLMQDAGIDAHDLHRHLRRHSGPLRACYESALDSNAATNGCMQVQIRFDERGVVTRAWVDWGTLDIERINRCLVAEIRRWKVKPVLPRPTMAVVRLDFSARTH